MASRDELLDALVDKPLTISELAERFGVARNAIVVQLKRLETDGMVVRTEARSEGSVGKPASRFSAAPGIEDRNSTAYAPFATLLAGALADTMPLKQRRALYEKIGLEMASHLEAAGTTELKEKLKVATSIPDSLGANTRLLEDENAYYVRSYHCPLAKVVRADPLACCSLRAYFEAVTGQPCADQCSYGEKLVCTFEIKKPED